jgi:hypothetical protein
MTALGMIAGTATTVLMNLFWFSFCVVVGWLVVFRRHRYFCTSSLRSFKVVVVALYLREETEKFHKKL